jgi:Ulp1 family protease
LTAESTAKGVAFDAGEWTEYPEQLNSVPTQENGCDCGMFVILVIDSIFNSLPLSSYSQSDMPEYRLKLAQAILQQSLYNEDQT